MLSLYSLSGSIGEVRGFHLTSGGVGCSSGSATTKRAIVTQKMEAVEVMEAILRQWSV